MNSNRFLSPFIILKELKLGGKTSNVYPNKRGTFTLSYAHKIFCDMKKVIKNDNRITGGVKVFKQKSLQLFYN